MTPFKLTDELLVEIQQLIADHKNADLRFMMKEFHSNNETVIVITFDLFPAFGLIFFIFHLAQMYIIVNSKTFTTK